MNKLNSPSRLCLCIQKPLLITKENNSNRIGPLHFLFDYMYLHCKNEIMNEAVVGVAQLVYALS